MRGEKKTNITFGDLVAAVTEEVEPLSGNKRRVNRLVSYILQDLFLSCRVRLRNGFVNRQRVRRQKWPAMALGLLLLIAPESSFAGAATDQLKQSVESRRQQLKRALGERFAFDEMAKRSLGAQWQKRTASEQQEFVRLFTDLLEGAYLSKLEEYSGEKIQFVNERQEKDFAEVNTKVVNRKGEDFALDYRLMNINGDWKVTDVVIENISVVNNYRSQFNRVLSKSSFEDLTEAMKQKKISAPVASN
jgi:phospholipid transport system substrate-binding protein